MYTTTMDDDAQQVKTPSSQTKSYQLSQATTNVLWNEQKVKRQREKNEQTGEHTSDEIEVA